MSRSWGALIVLLALLCFAKFAFDAKVSTVGRSPLPAVMTSAPAPRRERPPAEFLECNRSVMKIVYGMIAGPNYVQTRVVPALRTWLRDEVTVVYLEREDDPAVLAAVEKHLTGPTSTVRDVNFTVKFLHESELEKQTRAKSGAGAWKNLLILEDLWKRHPDADWFMTVDDDGFILQDNLRILLSSNYVPRQWAEQHCASERRGRQELPAPDRPRPPLGAKYIGCTMRIPINTDPGAEFITFAHGGAGFAVSHEMLRIMMADGMKACNDKCGPSHTPMGGDLRVSCCAQVHGFNPTEDCHFTMFSYFRAFYHRTNRHRRLKSPFPVSFHYSRTNSNATADLDTVARNVMRNTAECEASASQRSTKRCAYIRDHGGSAVVPLFWDSLIKEFETEPYISRYPKLSYNNDIIQT